jgi:hypothetical protein
MTDEERYIAQGRARDAAKKLRADVATLRSWFEEYAQTLMDMHHALSHWMREPQEMAADRAPMVDHVNRLQRKLSEPGFFEKCCELMDATRKLKAAEEQIKDF